MMKPILNELEAEGLTITRFDTDDNLDEARSRRIGAVPTMIIKKDGQEVERLIGAKDKRTLQLRLQHHS